MKPEVAVKTEQQLSLEMFHAAEELNRAVKEAQAALGKPVYLEIACCDGFMRVTPVLYPAVLFPRHFVVPEKAEMVVPEEFVGETHGAIQNLIK